MKVNLTIIFISVVAFVIAALAGGVVLALNGAVTETYYANVAVALTSVVGFGGVIYGQNKLTKQTEQIESKVNGNLSELIRIASVNIQTRDDAKVIQGIKESTGLDGTENEDER